MLTRTYHVYEALLSLGWNRAENPGQMDVDVGEGRASEGLL